ncbi:MAG: response regulator [Syntrophobacteraceae bacterium]|nr:response regulator [Syntrophobacteraceae bacterium]
MVNKQMSILVVDDLASMRMQVRGLLGQMGFKNITEARDGKEAITLLDRTEIDFVISDWNMPEIDGMGLLHYVRNHEMYEKLPFLMVTGQSDKNNVIEAVRAKVSNYIVKPFTPDTLEMKIRAVLRSTEPLWEK